MLLIKAWIVGLFLLSVGLFPVFLVTRDPDFGILGLNLLLLQAVLLGFLWVARRG